VGHIRITETSFEERIVKGVISKKGSNSERKDKISAIKDRKINELMKSE
jgi:hypothetical protein